MAEVPLDEFAAQLIAVAGSPDRIAAAAATVVENPLAVGPIRVGPGGIGKANAIAYIGEIVGRPAMREHWDIALEVPVRVGVAVRVTAQRFKFAMEIVVQIRVKIVPTSGLTATALVDEIAEDDVVSKIDAQHLPAKLVSLGYNIESEVIEQVIKHANQIANSPDILKARHVDLAEVIDRAWELGAILPHPKHALRMPETIEAPELPEEDPDEDTEEQQPHLSTPDRTLPLELPNHRPHTR